MTESQAIRTVLEQANKPRVAVDSRPWWKRLLGSLRVVVVPGKKLKKPISHAGITGGVKF